jgi:4-amino-4-deoxy-L-arabinose transferase-like glycosyltransferase
LFLIITQIAIASISGIYLYKTCNVLFGNQLISLIATIVYGVFPLTLWWSHTFATESLFQSLLIVAVYYFLRAIIQQQHLYSSIIFSAALLSLAYLTKSHILLFTPLIVLAIGLSKLSLKNKVIASVLYAAVCLTFSLPFGLLNLSLHNTYVISSNGGPFLFLYGNSEMAYRTIVKVPEKNSVDYNRMKDADLSHFSPEINLDSIFNLPLKNRNAVFLNIAKKWIHDNPAKFISMKAYNLFFFLLPGISYRHYDFIKWFFSFIISLPIYLLAYYGIFVAVRHDYSKHFWILGLFFVMLFFSLVFYVQNRFRTITLEPFYIMYAAYGLFHLKLLKIKSHSSGNPCTN